METGKRGADQSIISDSPPTLTGKTSLSDEVIQALRELAEVLRPIYERLRTEGYLMKGGKIVKNI